MWWGAVCTQCTHWPCTHYTHVCHTVNKWGHSQLTLCVWTCAGRPWTLCDECSSESPAPSVEGPASHHSSWEIRGQRSRYTITSKIVVTCTMYVNCCFVYSSVIYYFYNIKFNISWIADFSVDFTPSIAYIKYLNPHTALQNGVVHCGAPIKARLCWDQLCVRNMEVSVFQGLPAYFRWVW